MANIEHINYIKAPAAKVYETLTTQKGLAEVWTRKLIVQPTVDFVCSFDFNDNYATRMKVRDLRPNEYIRWECVFSDEEWIGTEIVFELTENKGTTALVLKQLHWKAVTEFYRYCNYNWAMFLYSLKSYCEEGKGMPFQERKF
ncbi:SRPBCC domain-containing protein [Chitinophaga pendula]|uniref:SRPBCC family protein n=1 Tax=Chitinophaga TaxID=79328 RepID=UPI000BB0814E|nr:MULTISPECIES: SRPBCC domain-containing protein [Chitinophaga]ASZ14137.1 ATPase [Chitinophaga sp. MD30]UCJ08227.1 SRPBCC domain-containing protein [Chitinophaga pendula]